MATVTKKTRLTDINPNKLTEEIKAALSVPLAGVGYHGFVRKSLRLSEIAADRTLVVRRKDQDGLFEDFAEIGEIRLHTESALKRADDDAAAAAISAHDMSLLTQEQEREDKDAVELPLTSNKLKRAAWALLSDLDKMETLRRGIQLLLRDNRSSDTDTDD